jgi:hypothetical protein
LIPEEKPMLTATKTDSFKLSPQDVLNGVHEKLRENEANKVSYALRGVFRRMPAEKFTMSELSKSLTEHLPESRVDYIKSIVNEIFTDKSLTPEYMRHRPKNIQVPSKKRPLSLLNQMTGTNFDDFFNGMFSPMSNILDNMMAHHSDFDKIWEDFWNQPNFKISYQENPSPSNNTNSAENSKLSAGQGSSETPARCCMSEKGACQCGKKPKVAEKPKVEDKPQVEERPQVAQPEVPQSAPVETPQGGEKIDGLDSNEVRMLLEAYKEFKRHNNDQ